ncbi:MAG: aldo/keto reductase [Bifidobacteriaceae bacterium]|jgi:aryl-alcohol dehydrogenase-like predicted oxidoreductase|nr:aldo/keto reductase [Bifidobacteriaceae bacterium]
MEYRTLGNSGLQVSRLALGSYHVYDRMTIDQIAELLTTACAVGINWFDVGHYASAAHPEEKVSVTDIRFAWAREQAGIKREDYIHTQKLWYGGPRPSFKAQFAESLPRAQVDYADLAIYNADTAYHFGTPVDMKDIVTQMAGLIECGWLRHWGINQAFPADVRTAIEFAEKEGLPKPVMMQLPYNAFTRDMVEDPALLEITQEYNVVYQASNVLAVGVLVGRPIEAATRPTGYPSMDRSAAALAGQFAELAQSVDATPAQLAIAFALSHPQVVTALFGTSKLSQLQDNLGALDLLARLGADGVRDLLKDIPQDPNQVRVDRIEGPA